MAAKPTKGRDDHTLVQQVERELASVELPPEGLMPADSDVAGEAALSAQKLKQLWTEVRRLETGYKQARADLEVAKKRAFEEKKSYEVQAKDLETQAEALESRAATLVKDEAEIVRLRLAAREGFPDERRELLREVEDRHAELLAENARLEEEKRSAVQAFTDDAQSHLEAQRGELDATILEVRRQQRELDRAKEDLEDERLFLQARADAAAERARRLHAEEVDGLRFVVDRTEELLREEQQSVAALAEELRELRGRVDDFGADPERGRRREQELVSQVDRLRDELSRRAGVEEAEDLRSRAERAAQAQEEAAHWRQQHDQLDRQLRYHLTAVGELEVLRDERDALKSFTATLRESLLDLRAQWDSAQADSSNREPFPACSAYDRDPAMRVAIATRSDIDSIGDVVDEVRNRMALREFYYTESDVRLFLAGMAASRLHLLQGISGTGKTSLPREFFRALGDDEPAVVPVQAGWRDRDDLFGYYNAFEKRFAESEFTKALYRALTPARRDVPTVIVLDEMNLAHPEQYFGTMLSALENAAGGQARLDLITTEIPGLPELFEEGRLPLPHNVWFVGTANHDETTVAFADKTYDRAHVQELPNRRTTFTPRHQGAADPVSYSALVRLFNEARSAHRKDVLQAADFLSGELQELFIEFDVSWGNRLERQVESFVPVVRAAGGSLTEAVDHVLVTKVVRKVEDRFGVRADDLERLADDVEALWSLDGGAPSKTLDRLRAEARKIGEGIGR